MIVKFKVLYLFNYLWFRYIRHMKNLLIFENFNLNEEAGNPKYTEEEIASVLENFDGGQFFKVDIEKSKVEFSYPSKLEDREDFKNGETGKLEFYISDVIYEIDPKFISELKVRFDALGKTGEDVDNIMADLDKIGFSEVETATWDQIQKAIEKRFKDKSPGFVYAEMPEFNFAYDVEQEGPYLNVTLVIEDFVGDIRFDQQDFSDDILTELFYKK
jgi:hypothetical protein